MKTSANRQPVGKAGKPRGTSRVSSTPDVNAAQATAPSSCHAKSGTTDGSGPAFQPHGSPKSGAKHILMPCLAVATFISVVCLLKLLGAPEARRQGPCSDTEEQLSVQTSLGVIKSTAAATSNGQYARVFLGIPFGEGTSGARRFDLATKVTKLRSPFAAVKQGPACLQPELQIPLLRAVTVMSDNCLTLNIWTPSRCSMGESESLPVIFFLGGWMFHAASWNGLLDWASMAVHGHVIVVSPNFRLGAPGFLHRNGTGPDNVGVQDILLAWHWTKEHIASFGGNSSNVVPLGHASGGFVISALLAKPELFDANRSVILAQSMLSIAPDNSGGRGVHKTMYLGQLCCEKSKQTLSVSCGEPSIPEYVRCLAALPAAQLVDLLEYQFSLAQINLEGEPFLFTKTNQLPDDQSFFAGKDLLLGNTLHEADRVVSVGLDVQNMSKAGILDIINFLAKQNGIPVKEAVQFLGPAIGLDDDSLSRTEKLENVKDLFTKGEFQCPMLEYGTHAAKAGANVRYMVLAEENMHDPENADDEGIATYADDLLQLTGHPTNPKAVPSQKSLSRTMMSYVATFARTGSPGLISSKQEWPLFTESEKKAVLLNSSMAWVEPKWRAEVCNQLMTLVNRILHNA